MFNTRRLRMGSEADLIYDYLKGWSLMTRESVHSLRPESVKLNTPTSDSGANVFWPFSSIVIQKININQKSIW